MLRQFKSIALFGVSFLYAVNVFSSDLCFDDTPYLVKIVSSKDAESHVGELVGIFNIKNRVLPPIEKGPKVGDKVRIIASNLKAGELVGCASISAIKLPPLIRDCMGSGEYHYTYFGKLPGETSVKKEPEL